MFEADGILLVPLPVIQQLHVQSDRNSSLSSRDTVFLCGAGLIVTFYPLIESRKVIFRILTCRPKRTTHSVPSSSSLSSNDLEAQEKLGKEVAAGLDAPNAKVAPPEEVSIKIPK